MYCRIKGLREEIIPATVDAFLKKLDLEYLAERLVGGYPYLMLWGGSYRSRAERPDQMSTSVRIYWRELKPKSVMLALVGLGLNNHEARELELRPVRVGVTAAFVI